MPRKPGNSMKLTTPPAPIRYDLTIRKLRERLSQYEKEAANLGARGFTESERRRYQTALRELLDALIEHAEEIAKVRPQLKRPN